jgi:hypothetical protein
VSEERWRFRIIQDGDIVASGDAPDFGRCMSEASHYDMVYGQDGPVKVQVRTGRERWKDMLR